MGHVGMKYSLASRELICDSVETMLMAHQLDGLVPVSYTHLCSINFMFGVIQVTNCRLTKGRFIV